MGIISIDKILTIINRNIKDAEITPSQIEDNLIDLGMDSISFIAIIVELEEEFDCEIPDSKLLLNEMNTIQKIIHILNSLS